MLDSEEMPTTTTTTDQTEAQEYVSSSSQSHRRLSSSQPIMQEDISPSSQMLNSSSQNGGVIKQAKTVYFYCESDIQRGGIRMAIHPNRYRSMEALMTDLTMKMPELSYGVRAVFTPKGRDRLNSLDDFLNTGRYVCSQNVNKARVNGSVELEKIQPPSHWRGGKPPSGKRADNAVLRDNGDPALSPMKRRKQLLAPMGQQQQNGRNYAHSDSEYTPGLAQNGNGKPMTTPAAAAVGSNRRVAADCKRIYVRKNAQADGRRHVVLLNRRTAKSFEHVLDDLSGVFLMPVRRVCTEDGNPVESLSAIFNGPDHFVVCGFEPFRPIRGAPQQVWTSNGSPTRERPPPQPATRRNPASTTASNQPTKKTKGIWRIFVTTRDDDDDSGTTSGVFITVYGRNAFSDAIPLNAKQTEQGEGQVPFQSGQMDEFEISIGQVRDIYKIRMSHDNSGPSPGWLLGEVRMIDCDTQEQLVFPFNRWLDKTKDDGDICREMPAVRPRDKPLEVIRYRVSVTTGDCWNAGTASRVFITLYGTQGDTGVRELFKSIDSKPQLFQQGQVDVFQIEAVHLGGLRRCLIGHDGTGAGNGWFLEKVAIKPLAADGSSSMEYEFPCSRWLDEGEDDEKTTRELKVVDSFMQDVVEKEMWEYEKWKFQNNNEIRIYHRLTDKALRITNNGAVDVTNDHRDPYSVFIVTVSTSNHAKSQGAMGNIVMLRSSMLSSSYLTLDRGRIATVSKPSPACEFRIRLQPDRTVLLESVKFPQMHVNIHKNGSPADPRGPASSPGKVFLVASKGIFRDQGIIMFCTSLTQTLSVDADNSLHATGRRNRLAHFRVVKVDASIRMFESVVFPEQFLRIKDNECDCQGTGDLSCHFRVSKFNERGFVTLESVGCRGLFIGMSADGSIRPTIDSGEKNVRLFPQVIQFGTRKPQPSLIAEKSITKHELIMESTNNNNGGDIDIPKENGALNEDNSSDTSHDYVTENDWKLCVVSEKSAQRGSVTLFVYGDFDNSGPILLGSPGVDGDSEALFQAGRTDEFKINLADIGDIYKIRLELHPDDWSVTPFWEVKEVILENCISEDRIVFNLSGRLFSRIAEDHELSREVPIVVPNDNSPFRSIVLYQVTIRTGDVDDADCQANIFISLMGERGDTGRRVLYNGENPLIFSSSKENNFFIEAVYLGELKHCLIGHDNGNAGEGWFCASVTVTDPVTRQQIDFVCNNWMDVGKADGETIRILQPTKQNNSTADILKVEDESREEEEEDKETIVNGGDQEGEPVNIEEIDRDGDNKAQALVESITEQVMKNIEEYHAQDGSGGENGLKEVGE